MAGKTSEVMTLELARRLDPKVAEALSIVKTENPDLEHKAVQPFGFFSKLAEKLRGAPLEGITGPRGGIYLNQEKYAADNQDTEQIADTITHELAHQRQARGNRTGFDVIKDLLGIGEVDEPYERNPDELEAFQLEHERRTRMGRDTGVSPLAGRPGFEGGKRNVMDINLPRTKKR